MPITEPPRHAATPRETQPDRLSSPPRPLWARLAWLVGLWLAGVASLALLAYVLRTLMSAVGLASP